MTIVRYLIPIIIIVHLPATAFPWDSDGDGLEDRFEQLLLERFAPELMLSVRECDSLPAEFHPGKEAPLLLAKNATIYGQVFPTHPTGRRGAFIEVHYYHLWNSDCGLNGHALDAEHVSALLSAESIADPALLWKAEYWYAAAHEDTVCDTSHAVKAGFVGAEPPGAKIWISSGKHASFLDRSLCGGSCGADDCSEMNRVKISKLVNLGEPGSPMNGSFWTRWPGWPLASKMKTDFPETLLAHLDSADGSVTVPANDANAPVKATIHTGSSTAEAMMATNGKTGSAVSSTGGAIRTSLDRSKQETGNFLARAARGVWNTLGGGAAGDREGNEPQAEAAPAQR